MALIAPHTVGRAARRRGAAGQAGFTLVELMIWAGVAIAVLSAATSSYLGTRRSWEGTATLARIQRDGSIAVESIARTVRRGSSLSVAGGDSVNVYYWTGYVDSLIGCFHLDAGGDLRDMAGVSIASDVDSVRFVSPDNEALNMDIYLRDDMGTDDRTSDDQCVVLSSTVVCRN
jgi:Tfp pilus assembly protein PilW